MTFDECAGFYAKPKKGYHCMNLQLLLVPSKFARKPAFSGEPAYRDQSTGDLTETRRAANVFHELEVCCESIMSMVCPFLWSLEAEA